MDLKDILKQEIKMWDKIGHPAIMQKYVLDNGRAFNKVELSDRLGKPKLCFMNAAHEVWDNPDYEYVEGYMILSTIPILIHHAWVYDKKRNVAIEVTTKDVGDAYYGVTFSKSDLNKWLLKSGVYGILDTGVGLNIELMKKYLPDEKKQLTNAKKLIKFTNKKGK
jgi:hypothetical protein